MSKMISRYNGNLRTEAVHLESKNKIITDAPKDNQGLGEAFSPTDLLCTSLASCKLTIMGIKAKSLEVNMDGVEIEIEKKMSQSPRKVEEIILNFNWHGADKKISAEQMESLKRAAMACPVALSLDPSIKKTINW
ncbi:MAG: OsmC family protein [Bacteriovoracaceae bacterium]